MCGISGFLGTGNRKLLESMADSMRHRGPDDEGFYLDENVGFAFRRMSVIDVSGGHQPLVSKCTNSVCIVNGEIYNFRQLREELIKLGHVFNSDSDSEVVIHGYEQWSTDIFSKLDGMFALAIWDAIEQKLILARDPFGKKPLHYYLNSNGFYFASEIKTLLKVIPNKLDLSKDSIFDYFAFDSIGGEKTIYSNLYKVNNGTFLVIHKNLEHSKIQFWKPKFEVSNLNYQDSIEIIDQSLNKAVEKRLISDVPIGVFLSSGIDSAVIASIVATKSNKMIETYTFGFSEKSFDESKQAIEISKYLGLKNNLIRFDDIDPLDSLNFLIEQMDEPLNDPAYIPQYLMSKAAKNYIDVVITGDGGDELFFGYQHFKPNLYLEKFTSFRLLSKLLKPLLSRIPSDDGYFDLGFKSQRLSRGINAKTFWERDLYFRGAVNPDDVSKLFNVKSNFSAISIWLDRLSIEFSRINVDLNFYQKLNYIYAMTYLKDTVLVKVDRATMGNGLEARSPFLDKNLFEVVNSINPIYRSKRIGTKKILKDIAINYLPKKYISQKKHGFGVPVSKWLKNDLKDQLIHYSEKKFLESQGIFDHKFINEMILKHLSGRYDYRKELWGFLVFQRWAEKNGY